MPEPNAGSTQLRLPDKGPVIKELSKRLCTSYHDWICDTP